MRSSFNLIDIIALLKKNWRFCLSFTMITVTVAAIVVFIMTQKYKSSTTLLAGNPQLSDKARLFNPQIKDLYSNFGSGDDLDRIQAFAEMNSSLEQVVLKNIEIMSYYKAIDTNAISVIDDLRKDLTFVKTDKNQLIISCQSTNKYLAAKIVNDLTEITENAFQQMIQQNYAAIIAGLDSASSQLKIKYNEIKQNSNADATDPLKAAELNNLILQLQQSQQASQEYQLAIKTLPHFIQVMEKATPAIEISWPKKPLIIYISGLLGFIFSSLLVILKNQRESI